MEKFCFYIDLQGNGLYNDAIISDTGMAFIFTYIVNKTNIKVE